MTGLQASRGRVTLRRARTKFGKSRRGFRSLTFLFFLTGCSETAPERLERPQLRPGESLGGELEGRQSHVFPVDLGERDYLHVAVEQKGIDVVLRLSNPEGEVLAEFDRPIGATGTEDLHYISLKDGRYWVIVAPFDKDAAPGVYEGRVLELRPTEDRDRAVVAFDRAERLRVSGQVEHLRESLEHYRRALEIWEDLGTVQEKAVTARQMGLVAASIGDAEQSIAWLQEALSSYRELDDLPLQTDVHNDLGEAFHTLAEPGKSFQEHQMALDLARLASDPYREAATLVLIARRLRLEGRIEEALETFEDAIARWRSLGDTSRVADTLTLAGACYGLLGRMDESLEQLQEALEIRQAERNIRRQVTVLTEIGWNHYLREDFAKAIEILEKAVALTAESGRRGPVGALDRLGSALRHAGRFEEALEAYQEALALLDDQGPSAKAHTWTNLGELYWRWGKPERALPFLEDAIAHFEKSRDVHALVHGLYVSALTHGDLGRLSEARGRLERMLEILKSVRFRVDRQAFLDALQTVNFAYYEAYVDVLMRLHDQQPNERFDQLALAASERTRALRLEQAWSVEPAAAATSADSEPERRRGWLQARIQAKDQERLRLIDEGGRPEEIATLDQEQNRLLLQLDALESKIWPQPKKVVEPLDLSEVQKRLGENTLLLYYALGTSRSFLWRVDSASVKSFVLSPAAVIEEAARRCHELLNREPSPARNLQASLYLERLTQELLGPVPAKLEHQRLVVVPDASIQYVPFAALGSRQRPLIADHDISYLPSITALALLEKQSAGPRYLHSVAVFADPVFSSRDPRSAAARPVQPALFGGAPVAKEPPAVALGADLARSARDLGYLDFERLPFTREEAHSIAELFPPESRFEALDFAANREVVLSMDLSRFSILHFATHALMHPRYSGLSGIVLSLVDRQGRRVGGFLRAHDITGLRLEADLVVLSACRTAMGREIPGEGVIGLPHSFMQAGVPAVVVSQWSVSDKATSHLMKRFYQEVVNGGKAPPAALSEAQRAMLDHDTWKNPYYWAGFVYYGRVNNDLGEFTE